MNTPDYASLLANSIYQNQISIYALIVNTLLLLVTGISAICAFRAYNHQKERGKKEAACNLANIYAEDLICRVSYITEVFKHAKIENRMKEIFGNGNAFVRFDKEELLCILENKGVAYESLEDELKSFDPKAILDLKIAYANSAQERTALITNYTKIMEDNTLQITNAEFLKLEFANNIRDLLNKLEWFAMINRYCIADEEILYQSLQQSYNSAICLLYFYIASLNTSSENKYFTNIIWLYSEWKNRLAEIQQKTQEKRKKAEKKIKAKQKEYEKAVKERSTADESAVFAGKKLK